jgi:hypothetical protein
MSKLRGVGIGLFSLLLRFYPVSFRNDFGDEMLEVFAEKSREQGTSPLARVRLVLGESVDLAVGAAVEHLTGRSGKENSMISNLRRFRFFIILSPVILALFLLILNPRYVLRIFSDLLGWEILSVVVLGLCIGLLLYFAPEPTDLSRRLREDLGLVVLFLMTNLFIILGPALVMVFGSDTAIHTSAGEYATGLRWIMLGGIGVLGLITAAMAAGKIRAARGQPR